MKNCTGIFCPMQYGKVDPATCQAADSCSHATPPKTKADRIRSMTDEELAEMMAHGNCGYCKIHDYCFSKKGVDCDEAWLDWLKEEVTE